MDNTNKLSSTTIALHWMVASAILGMLAIGFYMVNLETWSLYPWHKSTGVVVFILVIARVAWRIRQGWPPAAGAAPRIEQWVAKCVHWTLLVGTVAMPVTGMIFSGASGHGFGTLGVEIVHAQHDPLKPAEVIAYSARWAEIGATLHTLIGYLLVAAIALHIAGAFKHHLLTRDGTLRRMLGKKI